MLDTILNQRLTKAVLCGTLYALQIALMLFFATGDDWHEYLALVYVAVVALHMWSLRWWFRRQIFAGRLAAKVRAATSVLSIVLLVLALASGLFLSHYVTPEWRVRAWVPYWRPIHMVSSFWLLVMVLSHIAVHLTALVALWLARPLKPFIRRTTEVAFVLWALYGWSVFSEMHLANYLFYRVRYYAFDAMRPTLLYCVDFFSISVAVGVTATLAYGLVKRRRRRR